MPEIFRPRPYQQIAYNHAMQHPRCAIWAGMGMGKTSATIQIISALKLIENVRVLVLAPLRVAVATWPQEVARWDNFSDLSIVPITGTAAQRKRAAETDADIHTTNYEQLPWLLANCQWRWAMVVADESTRLKSFRLGGKGSKRAKALAKVAFSKVNRFLELTGTPSPNGLQDLWGQLWFLDRGERLGRTHTSFMHRWFRPEFPGAFSMVPAAHAEKEITERVQDLCLSLRPEDYFDLKEPIVVDVPVQLPDHVREIYDAMQKEFFATLTCGTEIEAATAAVKSIKCLQIASGAVYTDEEHNWQALHDAKLDALESLAEESGGMPILVAYHFKTDLARLKERFGKRGRELDKNPKTISDWNAGKIPLLFAHPASAGHGLNLQHGGNIVALFSHWWDLEQYLQIIERIGPVRQLQAGYARPVYIYNIRAENTMDDIVIQSRTDKRKVQDLLLEAARRAQP